MNALEVFGILGLIYFCCWFLRHAVKCIFVYFIRGPRRKNAIAKEKTRWALITGATDGIGKAYAHALAKKGLKIILVSRNPRKLEACAQEITEKYLVETKHIAVDFTNDDNFHETIKTAITGLEIGVLVNNVGVGYSYPELFLQVPDKENLINGMIKANILAMVRMVEIILPEMVSRKSGVVINISSLSALIPSPYLAFYAASKAFVEKFSDDLRVEYEDSGVIIQTVLPGYVATNMSKIRKATWIAPSPDRYVASALSKVGVVDSTTGYYPHTLMVSFIHSLLYICRPYGLSILRSSLKGIHDKALASMKKTGAVQES